MSIIDSIENAAGSAYGSVTNTLGGAYGGITNTLGGAYSSLTQSAGNAYQSIAGVLGNLNPLKYLGDIEKYITLIAIGVVAAIVLYVVVKVVL